MKRTNVFAGTFSRHNLARMAIGLAVVAAASIGIISPAEASIGGMFLIVGNELFVKAYKAGAQIGPYLIVKWDTADYQVVLAAAATDKLVGVSVPNITAPSGQRVDVVLEGIAQVTAGGTVTRGDPLTSDASGRAVTAAPGAGTNNRLIGFAETSAVVGDIFPIRLCQGLMQG